MNIGSGRKPFRNFSEFDSIFFDYVFFFFFHYFATICSFSSFVDAIFVFDCQIRWYSVVERSVYDFGRLRDMSTEFGSQHRWNQKREKNEASIVCRSNLARLRFQITAKISYTYALSHLPHYIQRIIDPR